MKLTFTSFKDDYQQIKDIQQKWRNLNMKKEQISEIKRLQITNEEQQNIDFQLPDVFITTRQFHSKPLKSPKTKKKSSYSFDLNVDSLKQTKIQRNTQISEMEENYKQFKKQCSSFRTSPEQETLSQSVLIEKNQKFYKIDGYKFPYSLYQIHKRRKEMILDIYSNQTFDNPNHKIKNQMEQDKKLYELKQEEKRKKEYKSRAFLDNAYFSIISANKECKYRIRKILEHSLPEDSRFSQF